MKASRVIIVADGEPNDQSNGGNLTILGILKAMSLHYDEVYFFNSSAEETSLKIHKNGELSSIKNLKISTSFARKKNFLGEFVGFFPGSGFKDTLTQLCEEFDFELVISYHWNGAAAVSNGIKAKVICLLGDPLDLPYSFQFSKKISISAKIKIKLIQLLLRYFMRKFVPSRAQIGVFSFGHIEHYEEIFKRKCNYIRTPIIIKKEIKTHSNNYIRSPSSLTLLHLGIPSGTVTRRSLEWLDKFVFPQLNETSHLSRINWLFVGKNFELYEKVFPNIFISDRVKFVNHVEDFSNLPTDSTILVVPAQIELGIRTRILTAFNFGIPVLSHKSSEFGIPELEDLRNYFAFTDLGEFFEKVELILTDPNLRISISQQARFDLEQLFSVEAFYNSAKLLFFNKISDQN
jgi:glycosyltransferase involved in cell wall biosynthesis